MPAPQRADDFSLALLKGSAAFGEINLFDAIVALNAFERFVYVMSVLEGRSDDDCSALLRCSRRDVIIARELALERLIEATGLKLINRHIRMHAQIERSQVGRTRLRLFSIVRRTRPQTSAW